MNDTSDRIPWTWFQILITKLHFLHLCLQVPTYKVSQMLVLTKSIFSLLLEFFILI